MKKINIKKCAGVFLFILAIICIFLNRELWCICDAIIMSYVLLEEK